MPSSPQLDAAAPDSFDISMRTTKGVMIVRAHRDWAPHGVDRLYSMVQSGYFDSLAFYRTIKGFVAQFGFSGDTAVNRAWSGKTFLDDPVTVTNARGTLSFARPTTRNSRSTQLFFNWVDNPRLDTLNAIGFPPIAKIISGGDVIDSLNWEYSGEQGQRPAPQGPNQNRIAREGRAYLAKEFPRLDYIISAKVVKQWQGKR